MVTREEAALEDCRDAVEIVAKYYDTTAYRLRRDFRIRLLNTASSHHGRVASLSSRAVSREQTPQS